MRSCHPIRMWLFDHGSDWASRIGDIWARPFTRLEAYCNRRWWEEQKRL
jgi:hypothetical protein